MRILALWKENRYEQHDGDNAEIHAVSEQLQGKSATDGAADASEWTDIPGSVQPGSADGTAIAEDLWEIKCSDLAARFGKWLQNGAFFGFQCRNHTFTECAQVMTFKKHRYFFNDICCIGMSLKRKENYYGF